MMVEIVPPDQAYRELCEHFDSEARAFPAYFEEYVALLEECTTRDERTKMMRTGLAKTIRLRFPNAGADAEVDRTLGRS